MPFDLQTYYPASVYPASVYPASVLAIAALLDYLIGDPWNWLHPVQVMGWAIQHYSQWALRWKSAAVLKALGIGLAIGLPLLSGLIGGLGVHLARSLHPLLGLATESILLASCFAGRSLRHAAEDVLRPLEQGDLEQARTQLRLYVGRDTDELSATEIRRALLETVTENATDGVMAPLFYGILGGILGRIMGAGLSDLFPAIFLVNSAAIALAYKASSTLDSMVGYREAPYTHLGWASARLEDALTWIPCRLTVLTLAIVSGQPGQVWRICRRDAPQDPSPNAGWSECAYAAVLGVQMGGANQYKGITKVKPLLGDPVRPITEAIVHQAMGLTRTSVLIWLAIALLWLLLKP